MANFASITMENINEEANTNNTAEDRLSALCDDHLIHHILPFVSFTDFFGMRCLSKRWWTMWLDIPFININQKPMDDDDSGQENFNYKKFRLRKHTSDYNKLVKSCLDYRCNHRRNNIANFKLYMEYCVGGWSYTYGWLNPSLKNTYFKWVGSLYQTQEELYMSYLNQYSICHVN